MTAAEPEAVDPTAIRYAGTRVREPVPEDSEYVRIRALLTFRPGQLVDELLQCPGRLRGVVAGAVLGHVLARLARHEGSPDVILRTLRIARAAYRQPHPGSPP